VHRGPTGLDAELDTLVRSAKTAATVRPPAGRGLAVRSHTHGGDHISWQTATVASDAPTIRVARCGADVVIRHHTDGTHRDLRLPLVVWFSVVRAIHAGRLDRLGEAWTPLTASGGRARLRDGRVELGYGYLHQRTATLPAPVWRALTYDETRAFSTQRPSAPPS
jgi:hypothetical protein